MPRDSVTNVMFGKISPLGGLLALAACFPGLEQYSECADGGCGGDVATSATTAGAPSGTGSQNTTSAGSPTSSATTSSDGGGGDGAGGPGPGGAGAGSTTGDPTSSSDSSSSSGGGAGGGAADPCLSPSDNFSVQGGVLVEGDLPGAPYAFCIDKAEVNHLAYRTFYEEVVATDFDLAAVYATKDACDWKEGTAEALVPALFNISPGAWDNTTNPLLPIIEVDYCDAVAYCAWSGKRLCGGVNDADLVYQTMQTRNEWYLACSHDGERLYTYNDDDEGSAATASTCTNNDRSEATCPDYDAGTCQDDDDCNSWDDLWTADTANGCLGFDPRLVNMSGNVAEWVDACKPYDGAGGGNVSGYNCEQRGGSCPLQYYTICDWSGRDDETDAAARGLYAGFRCCWDAPSEG